MVMLYLKIAPLPPVPKSIVWFLFDGLRIQDPFEQLAKFCRGHWGIGILGVGRCSICIGYAVHNHQVAAGNNNQCMF